MLAARYTPISATVPPTAPPNEISIVSVAPGGFSSGVKVAIVFTGGLKPFGAYNEIVFTPASGIEMSAKAPTVKTLDASKGLRQITSTVPEGLAIGPATVQVRNSKTKDTSAAFPVEVVSAAPDPLRSVARGTSQTLRIVGSANAQFVAGKTSVTSGPGIKVVAIDVASATELLLTVRVAAKAPLGPSSLAITTPQQSMLVMTALEVAAAPPANRPPVAHANGPYAATAGQPITFSSIGSSDPDGDPLQFTWSFGDNSSGEGPAPVHAYSAPGAYLVTLKVSDGRGGVAAATTKVHVTTPIALTALAASPTTLRFSEANATLALRVTGRYSDKTERDLTSSATGTTYVSSAPQVATVSDDGLVAAAANGAATITVANSGVTTDVTVVVEIDQPPANRNPVANANGPYAALTAQPVEFSSTGSSDPDGDALQFSWNFGDGNTGVGTTPVHTYAAAGLYTVTLTATDGRGGAATATSAVTIAAPPNRSPVANANGPYTAQSAQPITFSSAGSSDPDGDTLQLSWDFGDGLLATGSSPVHAYAAPGSYVATLTVADGRGGSATATSNVTITAPIALTSLSVSPAALRFSQASATSALLVTGHYSDNSQNDLTPGPTGTTYESSAPQVASVNLDGLVTAVSNGSAAIAITNSGITTTVSVVVELGVTMEAIELTPPILTLRELASTAQVAVRGRFSDGSLRDLTADPATVYSLDSAIATVSPGGLVQATAPGEGVLTARNGGLTATSQVRVIVTDGSGFLRGEVYDDGRGLPLGGARATLLIAGGAPLPSPQPAGADDRGRFTVAAAAGEALLRIDRDGFTSVERRATLANGAIETLLDARLTRLDTRLNQLQSVFGGAAASTDGSVAITIPAGSLDQDAALRVTPISGQGLQGLLPGGWSPIAAVDVQPADRSFGQGATLRVPHLDTLGAGAPVTVAKYDDVLHQWVVQAAGRVSDDRRAIVATITAAGHYAFVVPDDAPLVPPAAQPGGTLAGVSSAIAPELSSATGSVVPRTAPPGEAARAVGTVILQPPAPLSSGVVLRARVTEQFDLLDSARITPQPFVQDVVLYARPRLGDAGTLAARLPITPSLQFSIQQLSLGTVKLDVTIAEPSAANAIIDNTGGSVSSANGDVLTLPAGAIGAEIAVGLLPLSASGLSAAVPAGMTLLGAVFVDAPGASFAVPASLSIARPAGVDEAAQVIVAQVITDNGGGRRFKIAGLGLLSPTRIGIQTTLASLVFDGVRSGGEFVFLWPASPLGFITGQITTNSIAQSSALVTSNTAPFAFLTSSSGSYVVAGRTGIATALTAVEPAGAATTAATTLATLNAIVALDLALSQTAPIVTGTIPPANAANVALDTSIVIDFSKPIDPASATSSSVVLHAGPAIVATAHSLSANRRRLTITPSSPLVGLTAYSLTLTTDIRDLSGVSLSAFAPLSFSSLDPSRAPALALGQLTAFLPDQDGLSLITGGAGLAEPLSAVVATNLRSQETMTVLAEGDGSFRLRLAVIVGDDVSVTLRGTNGRDTTIAIAQFSSEDGRTSIGSAGGSISGPGARVGRILPRALARAGVLGLATTDAVLPDLPAAFSVIDRFSLSVDGAVFKRLGSLTVTESQGRMAPATALAAPFTSSGSLTIPTDFLVSASLRFSAEVVDRDGTRHSASAVTVVVASGADSVSAETAFGDSFPTVFLTTPRQAVPTQVIEASALAPAARIEFDVPLLSDVPATHALMLARVITADGQTRLSVVDRLARVDSGGAARLRTVGRELPGATEEGVYAIVAGPLAFVSGRVTGPTALVTVDGLPFAFQTDGANGSFHVAVQANAPYALQFTNAATGASMGTASGQAPAAGGTSSIGSPLAPVATTLTVSARPDAQSVVEIGSPIVFAFSEPIDPASLSATSVVVSDPAGARAFGRIVIGDGNRSVTFVPLRRWAFGTRYRYGLAATVVAASGARLSSPVAGEFTTFAPAAIGSAALGQVLDVATAGTTAVVGSTAALHVVNIASPALPQQTAQLSVTGGVRAIASIAQPLVDRNGAAVAGTLVAIASGDAAGARLHVVDLANAALPNVLGSAQLPGGVPRRVVITPDGRALVAIEGVGLVAVNLGATIPDDPANPTQAVVGRYPAAGVESITGVALLDERIVVSGSSGITVLGLANLERRNGLPGGLGNLHALTAFAFDSNGDGAVDGNEVFDVAVASGANDNTLQLFRVPATGIPELISAIRLPANAHGVAIDRTERLAYVSIGARGVAMVDLTGPASIQPLDVDRNTTDDRVLGVIDTAESAQHVAPLLSRGIGLVADGFGGMTVLRLLPPRVRFSDLLRDPVTVISGEEQSILASRVAFTTDDALRVDVDADLGSDVSAVLTIDETPTANGDRIMALAGGAAAATLQAGLNSVAITIGHHSSSGSRVRLSVRRTTGEVVAVMDVNVVPPPAAAPTLQSMLIGPNPIVIGSLDADQVQLGVAGVYADGTVLNLTRSGSGTSYRSASTEIAGVSSEGVITAAGGGLTTISALNENRDAGLEVRVDRPAVLAELIATSPTVVLRAIGASQTLPVEGRFSDGSRQPVSAITGTTFSSANDALASVDAAAVITALAAGETVITAHHGSLQAAVTLMSESRAPPSVSAIRIAIDSLAIPFDSEAVSIGAGLTGSGSLDGLIVTFNASGVRTATITGATDLSGAASVLIDELSGAGTLTITATVVDPATGETRTDSRDVAIEAAIDTEPNNSITNAPFFPRDGIATGSIGGGDANDTFRLPSAFAGTSSLSLTLADGADADGLTIVARDAAGVELARFEAALASGDTPLAMPAGTAFVSLESAGGAASYELAVDFNQAPIAIGSVAPLSGARGTPVVIQGSNFGVDPGEVEVLFGGIPGRIVSVLPTRIEVLVPGTATDGAIRVIAGGRDAMGPSFTAGNTAAARSFTKPVSGASIVADPSSGGRTLIDRLTVEVDPIAQRAEVAALAVRVGAAIVSEIPSLFLYEFEFAGNRSVNALQALRNQIAVDPLVVHAAFETFGEPDSVRIDLRDIGTDEVRHAFDQIKIFDAIEAIRGNPLFQNRSDLRTVRIAILDNGFNPGAGDELGEFQSPAGNVVNEFLPTATGYAPRQAGQPTPNGDHGTPIASVIGAINNDKTAFGVLNGVVMPDERPFQVDMISIADYAGNGMVHAVEYAASQGYDVVTMSFSVTPDQPFDHAEMRDKFLRAVRRAPGTLWLASAGNDGVDAGNRIPCNLSTLSNVMCIGAVATATDIDRTGDSVDERSNFSLTLRPRPGQHTPCFRQNPLQGSNCGRVLSMAAPGEAIWSVKKGGGYQFFDGTSAATPMTAGVAALLQTIRPDELQKIAPDRLKRLLVSTGDNISALSPTWHKPGMRRLNALSAARVLLGAPRAQKVFVTDDDVNGNAFLIGIEVDPLNGQRRGGPLPDLKLPLVDRISDETTVQLLRPSTAVSAGAIDRVLVAAETDGPLGDGIVVINSHTLEVVQFIALNGMDAAFPAADPAPPVKFGSRRPGLALSKDQRLLYVTTVDRLLIVNLVSSQMVRQFQDLPGEYRPNPSAPSGTPLTIRLNEVSSRLRQVGGPATSFGDLALAADGRTLYIVVKRGGGTGAQPGLIAPINVDLYTDRSVAPLLQSDLSSYLALGPITSLAGGGTFLGGDEPSAIAASPDGQVYLVNGGLNQYLTSSPDQLNVIERYRFLVGEFLLGAVNGGGSLVGLMNSLMALENQLPHVMNELALDMQLQAESGLTFISAPGVTGVFDGSTAGSIGQQRWAFTSDVLFGWNPPATNGGRVTSQFQYKEVFSKRPFGLALRPDGKRAILPFFQTGNFGVLDRATQSRFNAPNAAGLPPTVLQGVVGVTPAVRLDNHLWPRRGAYTAGDRTFVPSPDEELLYPGPIEYAQNGRFAAAVHQGVNRPRFVTAPLPDFERNNTERLSLNAIGFSVDPGSPTGTDPDGRPVESLAPYDFYRGGGTLTILNDDHIGIDLDVHAGLDVPALTGGMRPYFSQNPICREPDAALPRCATEVMTRLGSYVQPGSPERFSRPRGVTIQPFVSIETPRFGDHVLRSSSLRVRWRDTRVAQVRITLLDLEASNTPQLVTQSRRQLSNAEQQTQTLGRTFGSLTTALQRGRRYRVTVAMFTATGEELSSESIDVYFER